MTDPNTTDLVERLRRGIALDGGQRNFTEVPILNEAANEIERLRAGFLSHLQNENRCRGGVPGHACRSTAQCGCYLEMEAWCNER